MLYAFQFYEGATNNVLLHMITHYSDPVYLSVLFLVLFLDTDLCIR